MEIRQGLKLVISTKIEIKFPKRSNSARLHIENRIAKLTLQHKVFRKEQMGYK